MKSAPSVSCHGPRPGWDARGRAPQKARRAGRWIMAALFLALALAVAVLLATDPLAGRASTLSGAEIPSATANLASDLCSVPVAFTWCPARSDQ